MTFALGASVVVLATQAAVAAAGLTTVASLVTLGFAYRTGHSGGELVYKYGAASAYAEPGSGGSEAGNGKEQELGGDRDDDD